MERRLAIKQILIMAGGLALLPSCLREAGKASIQLKNIVVNLDQELLLAEIAETIIPKTNTPGAKDLKLHLFVLKMLDDCHDEKDQQLFLKGLDRLKDLAQEQYSSSFANMTVADRQKLLIHLEEMKVKDVKGQKDDDELSTFYSIMKRRTLGGFLNSKYVMSNITKWELVPGRYNGYYPVKSA